jgi:hypothetical protein
MISRERAALGLVPLILYLVLAAVFLWYTNNADGQSTSPANQWPFLLRHGNDVRA